MGVIHSFNKHYWIRSVRRHNELGLNRTQMTSDPALLGLTEQRRAGLWRRGKQGSTLRGRAGRCSQQDLKGREWARLDLGVGGQRVRREKRQEFQVAKGRARAESCGARMSNVGSEGRQSLGGDQWRWVAAEGASSRLLHIFWITWIFYEKMYHSSNFLKNEKKTHTHNKITL